MKHLFTLLALSSLPCLAQAQAPAKTSPYDSAHFSWRKPVPRNRLRELQPDRPGVTESPFTVDAGHFQLEMDALRLINSGSGANSRREWHAAYSMLKLGLSRRTDIQLEVPVYSVAKQQPDDPAEGRERHAGFGDVTVRLKHNFVGDDQLGRFAMSVIGYARLPTGGQVGDGAVEYGVVLPLDVELTDDLNLEAQVASELDYDREAGQRYLTMMPSVAFEYDFAKRLGIITEGVAQWNTEQRRWLSSVNVAPIIKVNANVQLDFGTHLALNRLTDHEYFVGMTLRR
ncbi:transporter [Hymenobacter sp. DH14]|uniref:Transporter n=1 Tax=Hymenobacter cyanobacteriorum TaxID=2926463 RepID=A0A9X2AI26_9BACT|nr:transporter [Hymenobacter cyanobacteriorum]MCI1188200.1 transporter [Hymenobacter cyanobacteriorum]